MTADSENKGGSIVTTQFQGWKTVALLKGLGFKLIRSAEEDEFYSPHGEVEKVWDGWEPSKDGSRLTDWNDLGDPKSPHYQRRSIVVYKFTTPGWFVDVMAWSSSPHDSDQLYEIIALSSLKDWEKAVKNDEEIKKWLEKNSVKL